MSGEQPLPTGLQLTALDSFFRERPHETLDRLRAEDSVHRDTELGRLFLTPCMRSRLSLRTCAAFSAGLHGFQPGGLFEPATDGK